MIIAGLMTGTSADGLDAALVDLDLAADVAVGADAGDADASDGAELTMRLLAHVEVPFPDTLALDVLRLLEPADVPLSLVSSIDARLGRLYAEAVQQLGAQASVACDLVVMHGQTVRHDVADGVVTSTWQLGQPAWVAERTGCPVLSDVRARDVAAGGQGAPLAGLMDHLLLAGTREPAGALNLGGIANLTVVAPGRATVAYDTGPANALIDLAVRRLTGDPRAFDRDGAIAARGRVAPELLTDLLAEPYYAAPAPKSTGKELFHSAYLAGHLARHPDVVGPDVVATLTALTARTVADACRAHDVRSVVASGGGTRNPALMDALRRELGDAVPLATTDEAFGLAEGAKEACLMALLGWHTWHGLPGTLPSVTGASHGTVAGRLTPGATPLRLPAPHDVPPARLRVLA